VTQGQNRPAVRFGIQIGTNPPSLPPLMADWTNPLKLLESYYNAIHRKEYLRAYSYWERPGTGPTSTPPFYPTFVEGYANTAFVWLTTGEVRSEGAAGTIYHAVPVVLRAYQIDGSTHRFYGCYLLTRTNVPSGDAAPPFPIVIRGAQIISAAADADERELMNQAIALVRASDCAQ
jgi:hypothetical protein